MPFEFTSEFREWLDTVTLSGPCCVTDKWTYGRLLITPTVLEYRANGEPKTCISYCWRTL